MPAADFDIYQTDDAYVAVTNEVRRTILAALAKKDRQLPDLVKLTKKAKPTLSSVHMRELLDQKLVDELPHPTDKRKKIYRLRGRRIGTSNLPVDQLRSAVKQYAGGPRATIALAVEAIAAAPASTPDATLRAQAKRLGTLVSEQLVATTPREAVTGVAALLEREGLARPLRLDLEGLSLELELEKEMDAEEARLAMLIAAFCEGLLAARLGDEARVKLGAHAGAKFSLVLNE